MSSIRLTPPKKIDAKISTQAPDQAHPSLVHILLQELEAQHQTSKNTHHPSTPSLINTLLDDARQQRATDIHLDPHAQGTMIRFRIDGQVINCATITQTQYEKLANQIKTTANLDPVKTFIPQEARRTYSINGQPFDMRITTTPCISGEKIAIRLLDPNNVNHDIHDLGLQGQELQKVTDWLQNMNGMFLVAGPTGSGKTTTLYSLLHQIKDRSKNIMTIEDPVEYQIDGINQIPVDQKHGLDLAMGLRTILRLDPDYLMLGEIRDKNSAKAASHASTSGHVLLSTIHSKDTVGTITSLRNLDMQNHEISSAISIIVTQRLIRKLCPHCKSQKTISKSDKRWLTAIGEKNITQTYHPVGCPKCSNLGFTGRSGIFSIWQLSTQDLEMINRDAPESEIRQALADQGHTTLLDAGLQKVRQGITTLNDIRSNCQVNDKLTPQHKKTA